jgi:hypothetical protein
MEKEVIIATILSASFGSLREGGYGVE